MSDPPQQNLFATLEYTCRLCLRRRFGSIAATKSTWTFFARSGNAVPAAHPPNMELLDHLFDYAETRLDLIIDASAWRPFSVDGIRSIEKEAVELDRVTDHSSKIDETVYDWEPESGDKP